MKRRLWYNSWTEEYMEGLPVGNGRLAAMMVGAPGRLRIALNHEWLWRGENRGREFPDMSMHLDEVREALLSGDFLKGTELANKYLGGAGGLSGRPQRIDPYQPAGDIWIQLDAGGAEDYIRSLDLDTGLAEARFTAPCGRVHERLFVSCTDGCGVADVRAEKPCDMTVTVSRIFDERCTITYQPEAGGLRMKGSFVDGISFEVCVRVTTDGETCVEGGEMRIKGATNALLIIQIGTDAKGDAPEKEMTFPGEACFDTLYARHAEKFVTLKGDAELNVEIEDSDLPTDERIRLFRENREPSLPLLYFEYGRYLLVSGSSGELPFNLQGKWNELLQPPWQSNYHLDINLQMCYWFVETLGMKDAANTLFNLIERYVPSGREMARKLYGCRGTTFTIETDAWGYMTPEACGWAVWVGATPWMAQHMFMHWRHTKDKRFLKERCYPFLKDIAVFYEDYLIEVGDELWIVPSQSPENNFAETGDWPVSNCCNCAMDVELAYEALWNAAESAEVLGVDAEKIPLWRGMAERLPKLSVDSTGRLNEWDRERVELDPGNPHLSHLYGLYPSQLFEPGSVEWRAAEQSLEARLRHGGGRTGWGRAWVACLMARLGRGEDAWKHFLKLIGDLATISLLDLHPPTLFQIDGNMGGTACVCEMLMQSRRGQLYLLPALPKAWPEGSVKNFRAQDGVTVSFSWADGRLTGYELQSTEDQALTVVSGGKEWTVELRAGETMKIQVV